MLGDKWSLGFIAETERQVCDHLDTHLQGLPTADARSRAIVTQMRDEERKHGEDAVAAGAAELPRPVKRTHASNGESHDPDGLLGLIITLISIKHDKTRT